MKRRPVYQIVLAGVIFALLPLLPFKLIAAVTEGLRPDHFLVFVAGLCLSLPLLWYRRTQEWVAILLGSGALIGTAGLPAGPDPEP